MKKTLVGLLFAALVLLVAVAVTIFNLGRVVRTGVTTLGPKLLGAPVELGRCDFAPLRGSLGLGDLRIGSPEGFKAESVFELGDVRIEMDPASLLSDTIRIRHVRIDSPVITYEQALSGSNIGKLQENIAALVPTAEGEKPPAEPEPETKKQQPGKKVVIDEVTVSGAKVRVVLTALGGKGATLSLPAVTIRDIGKDKGGASIGEAILTVLSSVLKQVVALVGNSADLLGDGVAAAGDMVMKGTDTATGLVTNVVDGAVGVVGDVAGGAVAGAGKAAGTVKSVGSGVGSALKGVGGLLGGKDRKDEGKE